MEQGTKNRYLGLEENSSKGEGGLWEVFSSREANVSVMTGSVTTR